MSSKLYSDAVLELTKLRKEVEELRKEVASLTGERDRALARARAAARSEENLKHALRVIGIAVTTTDKALAHSRDGIATIVRDALRRAESE